MRVIFLNRYFYPDHSATSQMLSDLVFLAGAGMISIAQNDNRNRCTADADLDGWKALTPRLFVWDYMTTICVTWGITASSWRRSRRRG